MKKLRFCKWDILPVCAVAALALAVFLLFLPAGTPATQVEIYKNGQLVKVLPLDQDASFAVTGEYTNVITVQNGKVAVTQSDCPGGDCKGCGWRSSAGSIVCLPNGVEIRVVSQNADVDFIVG